MADRVKDLLNELVLLNLNSGVTPWELMENISACEYTEINAKKINNGTICNVMFYDEGMFEKRKEKYTYSYYYDKEMKLSEIWIKKGTKKEIEWSRVVEEKLLIEKIVAVMHSSEQNYNIETFVNSLPNHLKELFRNTYCNAA